VRAAIVSALGKPPALGERVEPSAAEGTVVVELRAAALNPLDIAVAAGTFPGGSPPVPYVPGAEGVGIVDSGRRVFAMGGGLGVAADGTFSEQFSAPEQALFDVPDGVDDVVAAAFGIAGIAGWMPLAWAAPVREGESVLVLGATGSVGSVAVQAAKVLGAGRVVAAGRDESRLARARAYGADETVSLDGDDLQERLAAAVGESPPTLIFDPLWGPPIEAVLAMAPRGARIVQLGQSAGPKATLLSGHIRVKQLQILGFTNYAIPPDDLQRGYADLLGHVVAGRIRLEVETIPLEQVADAWARQSAQHDVKLVLVP
jgi:NADPH:quinone reductase-like Zn-dependent oxidoreductase